METDQRRHAVLASAISVEQKLVQDIITSPSPPFSVNFLSKAVLHEPP